MEQGEVFVLRSWSALRARINSSNIWIPILLATSLYLGCAGWRAGYVFWAHPPSNYLYSDMEGYVQRSKAWFQPNHRPNIWDAEKPPGYFWFLGSLQKIDPTLHLAGVAQFLISCAIPLLMAGLAYQLYGRASALLTLAISSVYFPFIDYAGYFVTELLFIFVMVSALLLLAIALRRTKTWAAAVTAVLAGITLGAAIAVKPGLIIGGGLLFLWLCEAGWKHRSRRIGVILAASVVGLVLVLTPLSIRGTRLNNGNFTLVSYAGPINVLLGHSGEDTFIIRFHHPNGGKTFIGSPAVAQKQRDYRNEMRRKKLPINPERYNRRVDHYFAPWEKAKARQAIWDNFDGHEIAWFRQSCTNVADMLWTTLPWPSGHNKRGTWYPYLLWSQRLFIFLLLLPAVIHLLRHRQQIRRREWLGVADGMLAVVFVSTVFIAFFIAPEARYRVPYDAFIIILATQFYTRRWTRTDAPPLGLDGPRSEVATK